MRTSISERDPIACGFILNHIGHYLVFTECISQHSTNIHGMDEVQSNWEGREYGWWGCKYMRHYPLFLYISWSYVHTASSKIFYLSLNNHYVNRSLNKWLETPLSETILSSLPLHPPTTYPCFHVANVLLQTKLVGLIHTKKRLLSHSLYTFLYNPRSDHHRGMNCHSVPVTAGYIYIYL